MNKNNTLKVLRTLVNGQREEMMELRKAANVALTQHYRLAGAAAHAEQLAVDLEKLYNDEEKLQAIVERAEQKAEEIIAAHPAPAPKDPNGKTHFWERGAIAAACGMTDFEGDTCVDNWLQVTCLNCEAHQPKAPECKPPTSWSPPPIRANSLIHRQRPNTEVTECGWQIGKTPVQDGITSEWATVTCSDCLEHGN